MTDELNDFIYIDTSDGYIFMIACKVECTNSLSDQAKSFFTNIGSRKIYIL